MLNFFKSKTAKKDETKALLAALYYMSMTDDRVSEQERTHFREICSKKGLAQDEISDIISHNSKWRTAVPKDKSRKEAFFAELVSMGAADGHIHPEELAFLTQYAKMMQLSDSDGEIRTHIDDILKNKRNS